MTSPDNSKLVARLDGVLIPPTLPLVRPDDLGVLRGDGVFETTLAVNGFPRDLDEHLARMQVSAGMIDLALPGPGEWQPAIRAVLAGWTGGEQMVLRMIATRGIESGGEPTCYVMGSAIADASVNQRTSGIRVLVVERGFDGAAVAAMPWLLAGAKTLSYALNMAGYRYAAANGADEVIYTGTDGTVLEAPASTVVLARGRTLLTPHREGILDGITARRLLRVAEAAGWRTEVAAVAPDELHTADGLWLTSSVRLLTPIVAVDHQPRSNDADMTAELAKLLQIPGT